ncbi:MAG: type II toxin-antitoxin system VapC family toxin [Candidatus Poribacteria bacterium]|nr:type II toxin-antitoxin system VapC family toxin [Candidatus Poribacteria bacterium]MDE0504445.1 type II toxin-antitoxin system VapC family toxin [Candidatus Poribacteria bacterium]
MVLSLDTHVLLWWLSDDATLSETARAAISDGRNLVFVSAAAAWEIVIKGALGKIDIPSNLEAALTANRFQPLPITIPHALAVADLPRHHNDPFDRLLVAQAKVEGFTFVTGDEHIKKYDVSIMEA